MLAPSGHVLFEPVYLILFLKLLSLLLTFSDPIINFPGSFAGDIVFLKNIQDEWFYICLSKVYSELFTN